MTKSGNDSSGIVRATTKILFFNSFPGEAVALLLEAGKVVGGIRVGYQEIAIQWLVPDKVLDIGYRD